MKKKLIFLLALLIAASVTKAQNLTISTSGQTGTSGTNWSTSGSNPVTITATGDANIHPNVITGYLNSGNSVIVQILTSIGAFLDQQAAINKTSGSDATLTMRANRRVMANNVISSTSGKLNVVIWSDYNNTNDGGSSITGAITTNGGHVWAGGSSSNAGSATWNGLTVGNGASIGASGANAFAFDLSGNVTTAGGDILIWTGRGMDGDATRNGIGIKNNPHLNAGSGNVSLIAARLQNWDSSNSTLQVSSTGTFTLASDEGAPWASPFTWSTTTSGSNVTTSVLGQPLQINNFASLSGFQLGSYQGMGSAFTYSNQANITLSSALNVNGPIDIRGGIVTIDANLTSSANGDIFIKGTATNNPSISVNSGRTINKSAGTGTLTLQGHARVTNSGTVSATGSGLLNVVMWSDFDNSNNDGGVSQFGTISTNGGHVWLGGSNSNGGSYTWNGLTVGDGPSIGSSGYNGNALDLYGSITSSNGHVFGWAGNGGGGTNGIANNNTGTINAGTGTITIMSDLTSGTFPLTTSGTISLVPNDGSYASTLTLGGSLSSGNFSFNTSPYNGLIINNMSAVGGLTIGRTEELLSNGNPVVFGNSSNVTITATGINVAGPINVYGGNIFAQQNLTSTLSGAPILLQATGYIDLAASRTIQTNNGNITFRSNAGGTAVVLPNSTTGAITLNSGSSLLSTGGNITLGGNFDGTKGTGLYAASARVGGSPGILISDATLTAAGGNINIYGRCSTSYDDGIRLQANISTTGTGSIGLYGDAFGGLTTGTPDVWFGGITFITNSSTVETENGNINVEGILTNTQSNGAYALNFYRSAYTSGTNTRDIQIISKTGDIQITGDRGTTGAGGMGHSSWGDIYFGSPLSGSWTASGDVKFSYSSFVGAGAKGFKVKTTGAVSYEPTAASFVNAQTFPFNANYMVADGASSLTIGKASNTANITMGAATTVAGPITVYGGTINVDANLTSTATTGTGISLNGQKITQAAGVTVVSSGSNIAYTSINSPWTAAADIGISLNSGNGAKATINAQGGNVSINSSFATTGTNNSTTHQDFAIAMANTDILTNGTGAISINGDIYNNASTTGQFSWGVDLRAGTVIRTASGAIDITGRGGKTLANSRGIISNTTNLQVLSTSGPITFNDLIPTGNTGYNGMYFRPSSANAIKIGSDGTLVPSSSSNVTFNADRVTFEQGDVQLATSGKVIVAPEGTSFGTEFSSASLNLSSNVSELVLGKSTNTQNITLGRATTIAGPITAFGGNIFVNENLNTTAGAANGDILLKSSGDITLAASKSITTSGGDAILWANSDNAATNGSIALRNASSITTGSGTVAGGHVWLGGGSDGATWNGLSVGSGYAVPGTSFTPSNGGTAISGGIYLEGSSINSFGGHVKLAGDASTSFYGLLTYAVNSIDSKAGKIELDGNASNSSSTNSTGILFGIHDVSIASTMNLTSSASDVAINISGVGRGTGDAVALSGTLNVLSTGTGELSINGNAIGTGRSIVAGNFYHGILNAFANSGKITLNGGTKAVQVATSTNNGATTGPSKINIGRGGSIANSSSDVFITADNIEIAGAGIAVNSSGKVTIEPSSNSFASALTFPITNLSLGNTVSGLTLGKATNTQNITFGAATTIAGPITAYGGNIAVNENLNTSAGNANGDILLKASGNISMAALKTITTAGGDVTFWANSNNALSGSVNNGISLLHGSSVATSGGGILLAGGLDADSDGKPDGYAYNGLSSAALAGVNLGNINLNNQALMKLETNGGDIVIRGRTGGSAITSGIQTQAQLLVDAGNGKIVLNGESSITHGIYIGDGSETMSVAFRSKSNDTTAISIKGNTTHTGSVGIFSWDGNNSDTEISSLLVQSEGSGGILIDGNTASGLEGVVLFTGGQILAASGDITIQGEGSATDIKFEGFAFGSRQNATAVQGITPLAASSSNINLKGNSYLFFTLAPTVFNGTGKVTIEPFGNDFSETFSTANMTFASTLTGLTIGKSATGADGTADQQVTFSNVVGSGFGSAPTIAGPITAYGSTIAINAALTATSNNITLAASSGITQSSAISANGLSLTGAGSATLTNVANNINTIAGGTSSARIGALSFVNGKGLTIGTVGVSGIYSTGVVEIEVKSDIQVTEPINSSLSTGDAIKLYPDKSFAAGTAGGNIKVSDNGVFVIASGARALLYSGTESLSTGLTTAVGGTANTRKNVDATTTLSNISPALSASGAYALYREATTLPVMLVSFEAKSKTDGSVALSWLTASELNNSYFEILRSTDGVNFTSLGKLNGFGNSSQENRYGFIDGYPSLGTNYYLLVQYDTDGTRKELGLRSVKVALKAKEIQIYPNPTKGSININLAGSSSYEKLELIDLTGKILLSKSISKEESIISFDMSNLASGIYQIRLSGEGKLLSKQIIKQ
nr:T9SS type A sorting domain-containing protein [Pedobacter glucosidilyticus]